MIDHLALIASADEFENIQPRESEMEGLADQHAVMRIRGGGLASREGKVNCLIQVGSRRLYVLVPG